MLAVIAGALFWSADRTMAEFAAGDDPATIRSAHERFPWEPLYALEAGARLWREGLETATRPSSTRVARSPRRGSTSIAPVRWATRTWRAWRSPRAASKTSPIWRGPVSQRNPGHPVLQGLWAYSAFHAAVETKDTELSAHLLESIEDYGPATPDAWHWIGMTYLARGDKRRRTRRLARARKLAPRISAKRYEKRLLRGR